MATNLIIPVETAKKMFYPYLRPTSFTVQDFIKKLFLLTGTEFSNCYDDYQCCVNAMMANYAVNWKQPLHLYSHLRETCETRFKGDVEEMFMNEVNTEAHSKDLQLFTEAVENYMDFHNSLLVTRQAKLNDLSKLAGRLQTILVTKKHFITNAS